MNGVHIDGTEPSKSQMICHLASSLYLSHAFKVNETITSKDILEALRILTSNSIHNHNKSRVNSDQYRTTNAYSSGDQYIYILNLIKLNLLLN